MPESHKFHRFAADSILFRGRPDWYYSYLKSGRIAQVFYFLAANAPQGRQALEDAARKASLIPADIAHLASGELDAAVVLADIFGMLSCTQMLQSEGVLNAQNATLLQNEYEALAERLVRGSHPSPFVAQGDFAVPELNAPSLAPAPYLKAHNPQLTKDKGRKGQSKGQSDRVSLILTLVRKRKSLSIKEIAAEVKGCSEKTIQRELGTLIAQGLIRKVGERRWSLYEPL